MKLQAALGHWWQHRFFNWVDKRAPEQTEHRLHRKNLYTFPTLMGFAYLLLAILIWLLGTNYQNNLILSLSYLLISLFVVVILHTYFNLAGLTLRSMGAEPNFAGEAVNFRFHVASGNEQGGNSVTLNWPDGAKAHFELEAGAAQTVNVFLLAQNRGFLRPERLMIESRYPLGLIRVWSWLRLPVQAVVWPRPIECAFPAAGMDDGDQREQKLSGSGEDFHGFTRFEQGHSLKTVAWKHYARERGLMSKQFSIPQAEDLWLNWADFNSGNLELGLSHICFWALELTRVGRVFGLNIPGAVIAPAVGEQHLQKILYALAVFKQ